MDGLGQNDLDDSEGYGSHRRLLCPGASGAREPHALLKNSIRLICGCWVVEIKHASAQPSIG